MNFALLAALTLLVAAAATAQEIYRWTDVNGVTHYSNSPPPETTQGAHSRLDRRGQIREVVDAPLSADERRRLQAEREALEDERQELEAMDLRSRESAARRARFLRQTFATADAITPFYAKRIEALETEIATSERQESVLLRERTRIRGQIDSGLSMGDKRLEQRYAREIEDLEARIVEERNFQDGHHQRIRNLQRERDETIEDWNRLMRPVPLADEN